jgi:hypothetical protein
MTLCDVEIELDDNDIVIEKEYDRRELEKIMPFYISNYFRDKTLIFNADLFSPKYINLCIDMNICNGVDIAYAAIEKSGRFEISSSEHSISEDIRFVIKILGKIKKFVPQEFSAGILLMHLELVEGIEF